MGSSESNFSQPEIFGIALFLDRQDTKYIRQKLQYDCFRDESRVEIELLSRKNSKILRNSHNWSWLIKFDQDHLIKFAIIEYDTNGIVITIFTENDDISLTSALNSTIGDSKQVHFTNEFYTKKSWGEILNKLAGMRSKYNSHNYNSFWNNNKDFAREFGCFLSNDFGSTKYNLLGEVNFPSKRLIY
jgi:hypothetical protein